jgi:type IV secretory pathway TrbD component
VSNDENRLNVIHQSLVRPILVMGAERRLAVVLWSVAAGLVLGPDTWSALIAGLLFGIAGHAALVYLAKIDPQFSDVYIRHWRLASWPNGQDYYPARAAIWAPAISRSRPTVPSKKQV